MPDEELMMICGRRGVLAVCLISVIGSTSCGSGEPLTTVQRDGPAIEWDATPTRPSAEPSAPSDVAPAARAPLVALIGASVTAGFVWPEIQDDEEPNRTVPLATGLRAVWPGTSVRLRAVTDSATAWDRGRQEKLIDGLVRQQPDFVVGLDFMFWFGYGYVAGPEIQARLQLQSKGFALLERFGSTPMLLGDYPDVRGADPRVISPRQIPSPAALEALESGLLRWADERPHVELFGLAEMVRAMRTDGLAIPGDTTSPIPSRFLLQTDRLHPRRLGVALLTHALAERLASLAGRGGLPEPGTSFAPILQRCRASGDLESALEALRARHR